jgi:hypothetical protein
MAQSLPFRAISSRKQRSKHPLIFWQFLSSKTSQKYNVLSLNAIARGGRRYSVALPLWVLKRTTSKNTSTMVTKISL